MLLLILGLISVALLLPLLGPIFVALLLLPSVANSSAFLPNRLFKIGRIGSILRYSH